MKRSRPAATAAGFTLIELLVVIGIIALLISILMPALTRARAHAVSVQCLSNLKQIAQAAMMYASDNKGWFPQARIAAVASLAGGGDDANPGGTPNPAPSHPTKQSFYKYLNKNMMVFHCPANPIWDFEGPGGAHDPIHFREPTISTAGSVTIKYLYLANPWRPSGPQPTVVTNTNSPPNPNNGDTARGYGQWMDTDGDGEKRDEYVCKIGEKNAAHIAIACDEGRQAQPGTFNQGGWLFFHGKAGQYAAFGALEAKSVNRAWKNVVYADGHASSVRPDEVKWRWGRTPVVANSW